jgi:hypothetical protein
MITEETYLEMVKLVALYESGDTDDTDWQKPYLYTTTVETTGRYNLSYGDDIECKCGHPYYRHFDTYDNMDLVVASIVVVVNLKLKQIVEITL